MRLKSFICLCLFLGIAAASSAQGWQLGWRTDAHLAGGSEAALPFWAHTGGQGILPTTSGAVLFTGADVEYRSSGDFFFEGGVNLAGWAAEAGPQGGAEVRGAVDRLYASAGWRMLRADLGMLPRKKELGELSITGGNMMWTSNARNIPGINLSADWIYPVKWFAFRGNIAHYKMSDPRSVTGTMIHDKSLEGRIEMKGRLSLSAGLEHIAQWGGVSALYGPQPASFRDYMRVFFAQGGGEGASISDQVNVLGNHLGREYIRLDYGADRFNFTFQYDKPFEDGSGARFQNMPDGVWTLKLDLKDRKAFVTDVIYEYINTTWQSGPLHDRPATDEELKGQDPSDPFYGRVSLKGRDNYFNNSMYRSGWTYYGRVIGLPLIGGLAYEEDGTVAGILCNRVRAHHVGLGGNLPKDVPYMFKATYSRNYGRYGQGENSIYSNIPWQLSMALEVGVPRNMTGLPVDFAVGVYSDLGLLYPDSFGFILKIRHCGSRSL